MEKYSAFRDPGTGIQPFLNPVPPNAPSVLVKIIQPIGYILGVIRTALIVVLGILYFLVVELFLRLLHPLGPLYRILSWIFTAFFARLTLLVAGLWWIPTTPVMRKRGRGMPSKQRWNPKGGDLIISNWASWIEILWFNPIFVLPVATEPPKSTTRTETPSTPTGRRTGTGSAAISSPASRTPSSKISIIGYQTVSLLKLIRLTGSVPSYCGTGDKATSLQSIRKKAARPVVVFPECTTSNGRAMLRFSEAFGRNMLPVKGYKVFIMCVRYDPPTLYTPTLTSSIPSTRFHPLPHIFKISSSLSAALPRSLSIRLLDPSESPSSAAFMANEVLSGRGYADELAEACSVLISQIGKMKVTGLGWEDKFSFLDFYRKKTRK